MQRCLAILGAVTAAVFAVPGQSARAGIEANAAPRFRPSLACTPAS